VAAAFAGFVIAFGWELFAYQHKVVEWAKRDLQSRADLAAANLEEPLRTQDFRRIHEFGAKCRADGYRLCVRDAVGHGRVYESDSVPPGHGAQYHAVQACGEYVVCLWIPRWQVMRPFRRALIGVSLAGLVGMAGVLLFFFVTYRQRVRIRELARVEKFRREFIADLSHEIRTPLAGILGSVDMLDVAVGDETMMKRLSGMIKKESQRLYVLVQEILDLARLEREGEKLNRVETDLQELARSVARQNGIRVQADRPVTALCDPQLLEQALTNLIVNAWRHSGSEDIALSVDPPSASGEPVRLAVEDHGVGIPPEHRGQVFERFHRVDPARAAESGGAGLGLAIVRRIARLHGGDVILEEAKPHGCRFVLTIPS